MRRIVMIMMTAVFAASVCAQNAPKGNNGMPPAPPADSLGRPLPPPGGFKGGQKGQGGPMGGPGRNTKQNGTASKTGLSLTKGSKTVDGKTYTSTGSDENVIQAKGGILNLSNCTINKQSGDVTDEDGSSFYGINSAVYASGKGTVVNVDGGTITTNGKGSNACFSYDSATLNVSNVKIHCYKDLSRGVHATGGGIINASNLDVITEGDHSSVVATDRGGGTVTVNGGNYRCLGKDCAILYSTGSITANNATGSSKQGEVCVIEGDNSIHINDCQFTTGDDRRAMMILQSGSGDSEGFNGKIYVNGSTITSTSEVAPLVEVPTNITGTLTLTDTELNIPSKVLMLVDYNKRWSTKGGTGNLILDTKSSHTYEGTVSKDEYGHVNVTVKKGVTWKLSADTNVDKLTVEAGAKVDLQGHKLTYDSAEIEGTVE